MNRAIVFDLLIFGNCGHFSIANFEKAKDLIGLLQMCNSCWRDFIDLMKDRFSILDGVYVYISNKSWSNLFKAMRALKESEAKIAHYPLFKNILNPRNHVLRTVKVKANECELKGDHRIEYCELKRIFEKVLVECNFLCGILCIGATFNENEICEISKRAKKEVGIKYICEKLGVVKRARVVEVYRS